MKEKVMYSISEESEKVGLPKFLLRRLCKEGKIDCFKSGKKYYINHDYLQEKLKNGELRGI